MNTPAIYPYLTCERCMSQPVAGVLIGTHHDGTIFSAARTCTACGASEGGAQRPVTTSDDVFRYIPAADVRGDLAWQLIPLLYLAPNVRQRIEINRRIADAGEYEQIPGFAAGELWITDPTVDESGRFRVDPVLHYGAAFVSSYFITGEEPRLPFTEALRRAVEADRIQAEAERLGGGHGDGADEYIEAGHRAIAAAIAEEQGASFDPDSAEGDRLMGWVRGRTFQSTDTPTELSSLWRQASQE